MVSSLTLKLSTLAALTLVALIAYFALGQFSEPLKQDPMSEFKATLPATPGTAGQDSAASLEPVEVMLVGLKQRLDNQPDDVEGWLLLSKSYHHLRRWEEAKQAFEKARALGYAGKWQPLPRIDAFSQNSFSSQNYASTLKFPDDRNHEKMNRTESQASAPDSSGEPEKAAGLKLRVSLDPALKQKLSPGATVFVFARSADNPGPPLAVIRKTADQLPFEIALNDSHAMIPNQTISSTKNVIVGARISESGNPERRAGDFEQLSSSVPSNFDRAIELVISEKI